MKQYPHDFTTDVVESGFCPFLNVYIWNVSPLCIKFCAQTLLLRYFSFNYVAFCSTILQIFSFCRTFWHPVTVATKQTLQEPKVVVIGSCWYHSCNLCIKTDWRSTYKLINIMWLSYSAAVHWCIIEACSMSYLRAYSKVFLDAGKFTVQMGCFNNK